ncbi:hypothetical protein QTP88_026205 [Uroleucon formosanum]
MASTLKVDLKRLNTISGSRGDAQIFISVTQIHPNRTLIFGELKRSRKEPTCLQDFDVTTVTGADDDLIKTKGVKSY